MKFIQIAPYLIYIILSVLLPFNVFYKRIYLIGKFFKIFLCSCYSLFYPRDYFLFLLVCFSNINRFEFYTHPLIIKNKNLHTHYTLFLKICQIFMNFFNRISKNLSKKQFSIAFYRQKSILKYSLFSLQIASKWSKKSDFFLFSYCDLYSIY